VKVAVVSPYALDQPGGVQDQVIEMSARLAHHGIEAWVVGPGTSGPEGARLLGKAITIPANGSRAPIALQPSILRRAAQAVEGADVVHVHEPLMPMVGWALLRDGGIPTVGTFHADPSSLIRSTYRRLSPIGRRMVENLVGASAVSEVAASAVRPFRPNLEIIPNGLDTAQYRTEETKDPYRLVFIGRDEPRKGLDVLLAAWPTIRAAVPAATLDVIGAIRSEKIEGVRFLGRVDGPEKRRILTAASIFVAPNLGGESFGITLLEGMAAGCAVVASDLPAFTAVGESAASFFPSGDSHALARLVTEFLSDEETLTMAAEAAVRRSSFYDWATVLPAYILMYRSALSGH
jgi:phosphatidylinositol alpha-mannosyltransferase